MSNTNNTINYIELPLLKNAQTKQFYTQVFGWQFTDWGADYMSFSGAGIDGGFNGQDAVVATPAGALVVLYADDLVEKCRQVEAAGGQINKPIYDFPGGKRFHFLDPNGNELAVWSQ